MPQFGFLLIDDYQVPGRFLGSLTIHQSATHLLPFSDYWTWNPSVSLDFWTWIRGDMWISTLGAIHVSPPGNPRDYDLILEHTAFLNWMWWEKFPLEPNTVSAQGAGCFRRPNTAYPYRFCWKYVE